jgi:serine/threonine protein phosphatase PrpC
MLPTIVDDAEDLYRSIRAGSDDYSIQNGVVFFSSSAFDDRDMTPSVDRSSMRADPADSRITPSDGITKVLTADVRKSCKIEIIENGKPTGEYRADAVHRPIEDDPVEPDNLAHCQVECDPAMANGSRFKKLKAALANLANRNGFIVKPSNGN